MSLNIMEMTKIVHFRNKAKCKTRLEHHFLFNEEVEYAKQYKYLIRTVTNKAS